MTVKKPAGSPPGETPSHIERVAATLREKLLRGEFRPGERLAELTLVPQLKASRTPVRLALERLAHQGLLEALPYLRRFPGPRIHDDGHLGRH